MSGLFAVQTTEIMAALVCTPLAILIAMAISQCHAGAISNCSPNPCENGGVCTNQAYGYVCQCHSKWRGARCQAEIVDDCTCTDGRHFYSPESDNGCTRFRQYFQLHAPEDGQSQPCSPGTIFDVNTCVCNHPGKVTCPAGCPGSIGRCKPDTCSRSGECGNKEGCGTACLCYPGLTGSNCSVNIDDCSPNPCENGGTCTDQMDGFVCQCRTPWTGLTCGTDVVDCAAQSCSNNGVCHEEVDGGVVCVCKPGWTGIDCSININECAMYPCDNGGTCIDGENTFTCTCTAPWTGITCGTDVVNCAAQSCSNNGECHEEVDRGVGCVCKPGWTGDDCSININECEMYPCENGGTCIDGVNTFTCTYVRECNAQSCSNNGVCHEEVDGGVVCVCNPGWTGDDCSTNINECMMYPCDNGGTCIDGENTFTCTCTDAWTGVTCGTDIDECLQDPCNTAIMNTECINTAGSFRCICKSGWAGENCTLDVDECVLNPCSEYGECVDELNGYSCVCQPGWTGPTCVDIDYCCLNLSTIAVPEQTARFYSYGVAAGDEKAPKADDGCPKAYNFPITMFGIKRNVVHVCYNGMVSLDGEVTGYTSENFPLQTLSIPVIAAYWTDLDVRVGGSLYYRVTRDSCVLERAATEVDIVYSAGFKPTRALIVTWDDVLPFKNDSHPSSLLGDSPVTLQLVIVTDDVDTYVMYIYGDIQWQDRTQVGFDAGDKTNYYEVEGTRTPAMIDIENTSNINVIGKYMFLISEGKIKKPEATVCGDPCKGNGVCTNDAPNQRFSCACFDGFSGLDCSTGAGTC